VTNILIADDNVQNRYFLETLLKGHGYEVASARNGAEALALALKNPPDIIVTDILMPEMDGFELCRRCKADELLRQIPFVFYTATYTDLKDEQFALSLGADRFVIKPQQPEVLLQIIQEVLDQFARKRRGLHKKATGNEKKVLQEYNEVLFRKLEKKVRQLEAEIEKQKRTENELRESESKYHTLVTQSPDGIFIVNLQGTFLAVNRIMCESLKYSEEELLSMKIWDIVPEQYVEQHKKRIADILMGRIPNGAAEYVVRGKDGELHYVEILSAPYYEEARLIGFQGIARDITERKKAEEKLKESEEKYRSLVENINDVLYTMDIHGNLTYISPVVERFTKYKVSDLIGRPFAPLVHPDDLPGLAESLDRLLSGQMEPWEFRIVDKDGTIIFARSSSRPIYKDGRITGVTALISNITERKQAEENLIKSYGKLKKTLNDSIVTMAKIVEMRDPYTAGHQRKVASLAIAMAKEMKMDDAQVDQLRIAATIHDIGKMYVPAELLSKPGKLSDMEFSLIKTHCQNGYDIIKGMDFPSGTAQFVLQHHERLDGSGYPNGLKGDEISFEARILAVADVVEAMASHRPYRPALGVDKALEEISRNKGRLYDPAAVDACLELFKVKGFKFEE
jgi:PAS domain S-box-containing protein/putative nucleotidyltransferase with HDIG domain